MYVYLSEAVLKGKDSKFSTAKSATPVTVLFGMVSLYIEAEGPAAAAAKSIKISRN